MHEKDHICEFEVLSEKFNLILKITPAAGFEPARPEDTGFRDRPNTRLWDAGINLINNL